MPRDKMIMRGRATDRMRGLHRLSSPDELRMLMICIIAVRVRVLRSVPERSHSFKECVTAHWSRVRAWIIIGYKADTEGAG